MILASSYWSLWIRLPAYIVGAIVFSIIMIYGANILIENEHGKNHKYPNWVGCFLMTTALFAIQPYIMAWNEKRVVAAFAEWLIVDTVIYGGGIAMIAAGYFTGTKIYKKFSRKWLAWLLGIIVGLTVGMIIVEIGREIPGVGWRIDKIMDFEEEKDADYDVHTLRPDPILISGIEKTTTEKQKLGKRLLFTVKKEFNYDMEKCGSKCNSESL
jgi:accessory gene regulator protein AgrB